MSDTSTLSLGSRLRGGASWAFAKFHAVPPLLTLPTIGLATWLATPYAVKLAQGRSVGVSNPADPGDTGGTTIAPRSDPAAHTPAPTLGAPPSGGTGAASVASLLTKPVTASMVPSWLPVPVPITTPAPKPVPPRVTVVQHSAPPAPRPKVTARLVEPARQQQQVSHNQVARGGFRQNRSVVSTMSSPRADVSTGRSAAIGGNSQWHVGGTGARGSFGMQSSFGGFRAPVVSRPSFGGGMRGGGGFHGGGHR